MVGTVTLLLCGNFFLYSLRKHGKNAGSIIDFTVESDKTFTELARGEECLFGNATIQTKKTYLNYINYESKFDCEDQRATDATIHIRQRRRSAKKSDYRRRKAQQISAEKSQETTVVTSY